MDIVKITVWAFLDALTTTVGARASNTSIFKMATVVFSPTTMRAALKTRLRAATVHLEINVSQISQKKKKTARNFPSKDVKFVIRSENKKNKRFASDCSITIASETLTRNHADVD